MNCEKASGLNEAALHGVALKRYLRNLPILDQRVLDDWYGRKKDARLIALEMGISQTHVERIMVRARAFATQPGAPMSKSYMFASTPAGRMAEK